VTIAACTASVLDSEDAADKAVLDQLRDDPVIDFVDQRDIQLAELRGLLPPPGPELAAEPCRWAYYPWRRAAVAVLGPRGFRAVRLDRNRNVVTAEEQSRLGELRIGVAGLSAGHVIAHTLAAQGLCGVLRLADFDHLDLSNLNRVPATVFDIGLNKAEVAARRIAELDPYLPVEVMDTGLTLDTVDEFLDGLNIVVEECDSLDMKAIVRERARARGIPVLMATSDRARLAGRCGSRLAGADDERTESSADAAPPRRAGVVLSRFGFRDRNRSDTFDVAAGGRRCSAGGDRSCRGGAQNRIG
jgi:molybdopterin/thiamine biosynthesis adenylyltransferase